MKLLKSFNSVLQKQYAHGQPPLGWHGFIESMLLEEQAAPPPRWWCLLCVCVVCCGLFWSSSLVVCKKVPEHNLNKVRILPHYKVNRHYLVAHPHMHHAPCHDGYSHCWSQIKMGVVKWHSYVGLSMHPTIACWLLLNRCIGRTDWLMSWEPSLPRKIHGNFWKRGMYVVPILNSPTSLLVYSVFLALL